MQSAVSNFLTTMLMFGSLIAIPALAVFGVPDIATIAEWADINHEGEEFDDEFQPLIDLAGQEESSDALVSPFREAGEVTWDAPAWDDEPATEVAQQQFEPAAEFTMEPAPPSDALGGWRTQDRMPRPQERAPRGNPLANAAVIPNTIPVSLPAEGSRIEIADAGQGLASQPDNFRTISSATDQAGRMTWLAAVERLNQFGIQQYRLQPGSRANLFHFSCFFTPPHNPRVYHRFEAEAGDPLAAVTNVLEQVESWHSRR